MYRLTGRLEESQLADLFRGERVESSERVVVKLFHPNTSDAEYARVIASLSAPLQIDGVAKVVEVGFIEERLAIVRQDTGKYSLGLALQRLNTREVILPPTLALAMVLELLEIIGAAHSNGVIHGALTPGNILLAEDGRLTVADFGALAALQASPALKKSFGARGRGSYRAPELSTGGAPSIASDIYALGAIVYELLTLREAKLGNAAVSTRGERLPPPSRLVRRLHQRVDAVIMRALENSPTRRQKSCLEFADGLREFLASTGGIPPRDDVRKFVGELFPNEVQVSTNGPVPFAAPFELREVSGAAAIEVEADERAPFSGGAIDDRTPTSDGLPIFREEEESHTTELEMPAVSRKAPMDWVAPEGAKPEAVGPSISVGNFKSRVRVIEDFAPVESAEKKEVGPVIAPPPRQVPKTIVTFAVPFKREGDPEIPNLDAMHRRAKRNARLSSLIGTVVLMSMVAFAIFLFVRSTRDVKGTLISYLPVPIQRAINYHPPLADPPPGPPVKLKSFDVDHPDKAFNPNPDPELYKQKGVTFLPDLATVNKELGACYSSGKGKVGWLTIRTTSSISVKIDGKRVCDNAIKIRVAAGTRRLEITEDISGKKLVMNQRVDSGKAVTITPGFPKK